MEDFSLEQVTKLFLEGDLPKLFNYIASEFEQRGEEQEQERIINLLEEEIQRLVDMAGQRDGGPAWRSAGIENCERTIALIRGGN
jgi:hypothetical protein